MKSHEMHTIGYEGLDTQKFLSLLSEHDIQTLVDIRELPLSRKSGFSKKALAHSLKRRGISAVAQPSARAGYLPYIHFDRYSSWHLVWPHYSTISQP